MDKKRCSKCRKEKKLTEFNKNKYSKDGYHHYCRKCYSIQKKESYRNNSKFRKRLQENHLKKNYNLSFDDLKEKLDSQNNKCAICQNDLDLNNRRKHPIDHNHTTGQIRGILCSKCNNMLGHCNDNIVVLKAAISYLKNWEEELSK